MKKLFTALIALLSVIYASAYDFEVDGVYYNKKSANTVEVTSGSYSGNIIIPESVEYQGSTYSVTSIKNYAFSGCSGLTSVTIPNSITSISNYAFSRCSGLTSVTIANSVTSIGNSAFSGCSGLTIVTIPNSVTSIEDFAFSGCSGLTSITIPNSVTSISGSVFSGCSSLTSVTIPNSVTSIRGSAFSGCSGLSSVTIPNSVTSIGNSAFSGCSSMKEINFEEGDDDIILGINTYTSTGIGKGIFADCPLEKLYLGRNIVYSNYNSSYPWSSYPSRYGYSAFYNQRNLKEITISNSVSTIGNYTFFNCEGLKSVTIPNSVTSIGNDAFSGCSGLTSITIPNSVTSIGNYAFSGCSGLTSVTIPNSVTSISNSAFSGCSGLSSVTIPNSVTSIGGSAFSGCSSLTSVTIPSSVISIGGSSFSGCSSLTSVTIPNSVTSIGGSAFSGCSSLTCVTIPNSVTKIENSAFDGCSSINEVILEDGKTTLSLGSNSKSGQFGSCPLEKVYIGRNLSYSTTSANGYSPFANNINLSEVTIGNSVTSIGEYLFYNCSSLKSVTIPNSVTSIGNYSFSGCTGLIKSAYPSTIKKPFNYGISIGYPADGAIFEDGFIYGPEKSAIYFAPYYLEGDFSIPASVTSIGDYAFGYCSGLTSVAIPNSVTAIGEGAFGYCSSLISVTIPNSVTKIEGYAFYGCSGLTSVAIPNSVTSIEYATFYECSDLTSITIPNSVTSIGDYAFDECSSMNEVILEDGETTLSLGSNDNSGQFTSCPVEKVYIGRQLSYSTTSTDGYSPFANNINLSEVTIGNSVTSIGRNLFYKCSSLTSVTIPNSVTSIEGYSFYGCSGLTSVSIPNSVTSILENAFLGCLIENLEIDCKVISNWFSEFSTIKNLTIGNSVTEIDERAFQNCSSLQNISFLGETPFIDKDAFNDCKNLEKVMITDLKSWCEDAFVLPYFKDEFVGDPNLITIFVKSKDSPYLYVWAEAGELTGSWPGIKLTESMTVDGETYWYKSFDKELYSLINIIFNDGRGSQTSDITDITKTTFFNYNMSSSYEFVGSNIYSNPLYYAHELYIHDNKIEQLIIPSDVTSISNYAFSGYKGMTSVTIGDSVTSIGNYAFSECSSLTGVSFGNSVNTIGNYAFSECLDMTNITIPNSVTSIGSYAFYACTGLTNVSIGNSVTKIGNSAFRSCSGLTSVTIPNSVNTIGNYAFEKCSALTSIIIPNSVNIIGNYAFRDCSQLIKSAYPSTVDNPFSNGVSVQYPADGAIIEDGFIYGPEKSAIYFAPYYLEGDFSIPASVTSIGNSAFRSCFGLTSVTIPNSVKTIGNYAFSGCYNIKTIQSLSEAVPSIQENTFSSYSAQLTVPEESVNDYWTALYWENFASFNGMQNLTLDDDVFKYRYLEGSGEAFVINKSSYSSMTNASIPDRVVVEGEDGAKFYNVTGIGSTAFKGCTDLKSVKLPANCNVIGNSAFENCSGLTSVTIGDAVTSIRESAFENCSGLTSVSIGNAVTEIGNSAFRSCTGLENVTLPNSVTSIGNYAFSNCSGLTSVTIGNAVTTIGNSAFRSCSGLTSITIGNAVTSIGSSAFYNCSGLESITIPNSVISIGSSAFENCDGLTKVEISNLEAWCKIVFFNRYSNPLSYAHHFYLNGKEVEDLKIPNSITSIKDFAFYECTGLKNVTIPSSVLTIGEDVFYNVSFSSVKFEDGLNNLDFTGTNVLSTSSLYLGRNYEGDLSISNFRKLEIGGFVNSIPADKYNKSTLTSLVINQGSKVAIEANAFTNCSNLSTLTLPEDISEIGENAFSGCTSLKKVTVPGGKIAMNAFANCNLSDIILGSTVESIGEKAFDGSDAINNVYSTAITPPAAENNTFSYYEAQLWVPEQSIDTYYNFTRCWYRFSGKPLICPEDILVTGPGTIKGQPGETFQLSATITPSNVTLDRVLWHSTNPAVATVDNNGLVTIHFFKPTDETMALADDNTGFCQIIASTLYENSPLGVVQIEAITSSIEYLNSEDWKSSAGAVIDFNDVYTLQGICLKRNASQEDIEALAPGVYIIGGKKVIVK